MSAWLRDWGKPIPETVRDHANADGGHGMDADTGMPEMLDADELEALDGTAEADFGNAWLCAMIAHHEGAVVMAQVEQEDGQNASAVALAKKIATDQEAEIAKMEGLLGP